MSSLGQESLNLHHLDDLVNAHGQLSLPNPINNIMGRKKRDSQCFITIGMQCPFTNTSRKLCEKNPQPFPHCGSFDHLAPELLNDYIFVFIVYQIKFYEFGCL